MATYYISYTNVRYGCLNQIRDLKKKRLRNWDLYVLFHGLVLPPLLDEIGFSKLRIHEQHGEHKLAWLQKKYCLEAHLSALSQNVVQGVEEVFSILHNIYLDLNIQQECLYHRKIYFCHSFKKEKKSEN